MPTLLLHALTCHETEEITKNDDAYIKVNGRKVWGPKSMDDNGSGVVVGYSAPFNGSARIELWEEDWGDDDFLGEHTVRADEVNQGAKPAWFTEDDARYELTYEVV